MGRPVLFPQFSGLRDETRRFYVQRALEGVFPTEDALQVMRNEETRQRAGERKTTAARKVKLSAKKAVPKPVKKPVYAWTEPYVALEPLRPMRITREDAMARKAW